MKTGLFPHISRKISAALLWLVLLALLSLNLVKWPQIALNQHPFVLLALLKPGTLETHLSLAEEYWQQRLWPPAKRELLLAEEIWQTSRLLTSGKVLGATTVSPRELLRQWQSEPERLRAEYQFWQTVSREKTDYRDAYLQLGSLAYQLSLTSEAQQAWEAVLRLDPNNPLAKRWLGR